MTNVLWVIMDDARRDIIDTMPHTRALAKLGTTFTRAVSETPVCYPARANLLTGQSAGRTQIVDWFGVDLAAAITAGRWSYDTSFASWLSHESLAVGKYLNTPNPLTAAGWTRFRQPDDAHAHVVTEVNDGGGFDPITPVWHTDWAMTEIAAHRSAVGSDPWLVYWSSNAPHLPFDAPPDHLHVWPRVEAPREPQSGTGWPSWITDLDEVTDWKLATRIRRDMIREAAEIDAKLGELMATIDLAETFVVVTSDNGAHHGDHRLLGEATKNRHYEQAYGIPMVVAGPGIPAGVECDVPVSLLDITATITAIDEATPPHPLDGEDLRDIANNPGTWSGRALLGRRKPGGSGGAEGTPNTDWVYTGDRKLARHSASSGFDPVGQEFEMYDLDTDPGELVNVAYEPSREGERDDLEAQLDALLTF